MLILRPMRKTQNTVFFTSCLAVPAVTTRLISPPQCRMVKEKRCTVWNCSRILHIKNRSCGLKLKRLFPNDVRLLFTISSVSRSEFQANRTSGAINCHVRTSNSLNAILNARDTAPKLLPSLRFLAVQEIKDSVSNKQLAICVCTTHYRFSTSVKLP